ncbi:Synaptotagmin 12 [Carabus blaptoides fortunei]
MGDLQVAVTLLGLVAIVLLVVFAACHFLGLWTWTVAWLYSTREEKIGLTRSKGHYNANGYLIHSDSDIQLDAAGSFKRFDPVDRDFKVTYTTTNLMTNEWREEEVNIPPQPLRPAPLPIPLPPPIGRAPKLPPDMSSCAASSVLEEMSSAACRNQYPSMTTPASPSVRAVCTAPQAVKHQLNQQASGNGRQLEEAADIAAAEQQLPAVLKRAMSCDSVCSDTSVVLGDLEEPNISGYLCIGIEYDSECSDLAVSVLEAKDLIGPNKEEPMDTYIRVYLLPDKSTNLQTRLYRHSNSPSYKERFLFSLNPREASQRTLCFHVYSTDRLAQTLVGEAELRLAEISLRQPVTTWVTLTDTGQRGTEFGEVMFSLSYLPTAERLTVVIVKARNLRFQHDKDSGDPFVKVYLLQHGKKVHKKKTSTKKGERSPIFNEAMIFGVPAHTLQSIQLRVTVAESTNTETGTRGLPIGHVIVSAQASGRALSHWNQMLSALRKPVAMWHPLRK